MDYEAFVREILLANDFNVDKIDETYFRTPDFSAYDGQNSYLIEVKTHQDDEQEEARRIEILRKGQIYSSKKTMGATRKACGKIDDTYDQLISQELNSDFRVAWFFVTSRDALVEANQIRASLYGSTSLLGLPGGLSQTCYYFHFGRFYNLKLLDAVVVMFEDHVGFRGLICINNYSARYLEFRQSDFVKRLAIPVLDPVDEVTAGRALILDADVDRRDERKVLEYLREKLGCRSVFNATLPQRSAEVAIELPKQ